MYQIYLNLKKDLFIVQDALMFLVVWLVST